MKCYSRQVRFLVRTWVVVTELFCGIPQFFQVNIKVLPWNKGHLIHLNLCHVYGSWSYCLFYLVKNNHCCWEIAKWPMTYPNIKRTHLLYFLICTRTNKCIIISQIITLLHFSTLSCHPQGARNQYFAKSHNSYLSIAVFFPFYMFFTAALI